MTTTLMVSAAAVRDYLALNPTATSSKYTDATINSNVRAAQSALEQACSRYFAERDAFTYRTTSLGRAQVFIPGFSTLTTVYYQGVLQTIGYDTNSNGATCWALPDALQTGVYTAIQFRPWYVNTQGGVPGTPYGPWIANPNWFDQAADSPFYPPNYGGGLAFNSMPNDMIVTGTAGYAAGSEPDAVLQAVKVLAAFYTLRPASILARSA